MRMWRIRTLEEEERHAQLVGVKIKRKLYINTKVT